MNKDLKENSVMSHYRIISKIGKGGMGEVYLADDTKLDRQVALKILPAEFAEDTERMSRFVREAKSASALNHPNIITIYEIGEFEGSHYIAAEFIEGDTLNKYLKANSIKLGSILDIAIQIGSALDEAHSAGIVHRDIKPDNIMIRSNGFVKILDFGIAKLTEKDTPEIESEDATAIHISTTPGMIIGTANYMSPEQAKGKEVDARTDIFSFGVVLYEVASGKLPFDGETAMEMIGAIIHKEPKPLKEVHPDLEKIINKTLKKDVTERYKDAKELLEDLQTLKKRIEFEAELERTSLPDKKPEAKTQILKADTSEEKNAIHTVSNTNSIAVMPFEHLSSDEDNEYFCDGLAEELINALARVERLEVAARSSSFSFKGKNASVSEISEVLNVRNILEGSVRKAGNRLRISVQLVNATDGYQIWSERYDREMKDIFDVQDEIALAVVEALKVKLLGSEKGAVLKKYTSNAEAYQLYLKGRFFFAKRTPEGFNKAIENYQKAIDIDSEYAIAYSGLVDCYVILGYYELLPTEEAEGLSVPLARKAMQLDDTIAEVWASNGLSEFFWDLSKSDAHYQKAISLNPKYAAAYHFRSTSLILLGRSQETIDSSKRAIELEPFSISFNATLAWWYYLSDRSDEAIKQSLKSIEIAPHFLAYWVLGLAFSRKRNFTKAISNMQTARELSGNMPVTVADLAWIYAKSGEQDKARDLLDELKQISKSKYVSPTNFAKIYLGLGETQKAFEELDKAFEKRAFRLAYFLIDPIFDVYRSEPRIQEILRELNLPTNQPPKDTDGKLEAKTVMLKQETADVTENNETVSDKERNVSQDKPKSKRNWWWAGLLSLLVLTIGFFGYYYFTANSKQIESIAVMPFVNESGDKDVEYLSDGMTETLINSLTQLPQVSVKARNSVFRYKGKEISPKKVGVELDVEAVLLGTVVQRGMDVAINLELVDSQTENILWSKKYNRKMTNLVTLQNEIATNVSDSLKVKLSGEEQRKVTEIFTENPKAYQAYLKGRFYWNRRTEDDLKKSIESFKEAIEIDQNYALAWSGLADSYHLIPIYGNTSPVEVLDKAKAAARKAIELNPNIAEAHNSLGGLTWRYDWNFAEGEKLHKRAIELNPKYATNHYWYAWLLIILERQDEAIKEFETALQLDPFSRAINLDYGYALMIDGQLDESITQIEKSIKLDTKFAPNYSVLAIVYELKKMYPEAVENYLKALELSGIKSSEFIVEAERKFKSGGFKEFNDYLFKKGARRMHSRRGENNLVGHAEAYTLQGDKETAIEYLKKAYEERNQLVVFIKVLPFLKPLHDEPEFKKLVRKIGLPE